ncbi:hypothetical protein B5E84_18945 [Lachnoclostridium sp. An14]|uniref:hypothetical protein n=1 Tax=Lachnoclostridium sp. An14 TaxID=1965562 RepID=UPI000B39298E|nr:hypothetical protein [Lachnoclostridium sp. An14]OUQ12405.1 hypothetical protein B5E84_18945 [Lachnoclostridium sp. An14]
MAITVSPINLEPEIQQWEDAYCGEDVRQANIDAFEKIQASVNEAIAGVTQVANSADQVQQSAIQAAGQAAAAAENANQALENVEEVRQDLADRVASGEFDGAPGEQGPPGPQGESGVMAPASGMFSLYLDPATGDLYAEYPDGSTPPQFEYDSESGNLYFVTDD